MPAVFSLLLSLVLNAAPPAALHTVASLDRVWRVEWLGKDGACTGMRFSKANKLVPATRFTSECSAVRTPFSPDGQWVLLQMSDVGPLHLVPVNALEHYLDGGMPEAVLYASEQAGMPPSPERRLVFLRWSGPAAFEVTGAAQGALTRYSYAVGGKMLQTCYLDGHRRQCAFPSVDGAYTVFTPQDGFHVVARAGLPAFLAGQGGEATRFPNASMKDVVRPVFVGWQDAVTLLLRSEDDNGFPITRTYNVTSRTLGPAQPVKETWTGWPPP